jgi:outer membrane protein OmpA-like peptidoglycan-associated protein
MRRPLLLPTLAATAFALSTVPSGASAQGFLKRVKQAAQDAAAEAATRKVGEAARSGTEKSVDAATDAAGNRIAGLVGNAGASTPAEAAAAKAAPAKGAPAKAAGTPAGAPANARAAGETAPAPRPGEGAWTNYDFVPGNRVLFADDFTAETVGNFPRRLTHKAGAAEVVEWQGKRWLSSAGQDAFVINLPEVLPQQFTMEFDLAGAGNGMVLYFDGRSAPHERGSADGGEHLAFGSDFASLNGPTRAGSSTITGRDTKKEVVRARIMADGEYVKVFVNERRVVNVPNAKLGRTKQIYVGMYGWSAEAPRMIGDVRIAAGGRKLYDALADKGRVATQGILFATGSDAVRPESGPTLKEIAGMLTEHPELKLTIEGHTDDVGDAAANQALSQARAEAVRKALASGYGVDAARLEAKGFGASKPAAPNSTAEGRAANRRVELVRR